MRTSKKKIIPHPPYAGLSAATVIRKGKKIRIKANKKGAITLKANDILLTVESNTEAYSGTMSWSERYK